MPEKLFESENLTFNLNTLGIASAAAEENTSNEKESSDKIMPEKYNWGWWKAELSKRLEKNNKQAPDKRKSDTEIELEFFKDFFQTNWTEESASKLIAIGEPLRNVIKVLGFDPKNIAGGNPILAFMRQGYVQKHLLQSGLLNASTFRAVYNTIPERLIAHSEFFNKNEYNILYCKDLYTKSPKEMLEYFRLQSKILKTSATEYTQADINNNKKTFLQSKAKDILDELNPVKRAKAVNTLVKNEGITKLALSNIEDSKLNSLEVAQLINGDTGVEKVHLDTAGQNKIIEAIKDSYAKIYATLLSICLSTGSKKARNALKNGLLAGLSATQISEATAWLAENKIITKGELQGEDADALVDKINTLLSERGQQ